MKAVTILFRTPEKSDTRNEKAEKEEKSGKELKRKKDNQRKKNKKQISGLVNYTLSVTCSLVFTNWSRRLCVLDITIKEKAPFMVRMKFWKHWKRLRWTRLQELIAFFMKCTRGCHSCLFHCRP